MHGTRIFEHSAADYAARMVREEAAACIDCSPDSCKKSPHSADQQKPLKMTEGIRALAL